MSLTQDELTVLMIAAEGESMMPIGRWEAPTRALVAKGYLLANDKYNNVITEAGRQAAEQADNANIRDMVKVNNDIVEARQKAAARGDEIAALLAELATYSASMTGDDKVKALRNWAKVVLEKALEII
jgi:hypothetical protein